MIRPVSSKVNLIIIYIVNDTVCMIFYFYNTILLPIDIGFWYGSIPVPIPIPNPFMPEATKRARQYSMNLCFN